MKEWASKSAIIEEVADVPENWLRCFAVRHPADFRKFATTRNGSALYRVKAVLQAIEDGEGMPNGGIKEGAFEIKAGMDQGDGARASSGARGGMDDRGGGRLGADGGRFVVAERAVRAA